MKKLFKKIARNSVFPLIVAAGREKKYSNSSTNQNMVLCYHGVDLSGSNLYNGRHISSKVFERHLVYLKKNFEIVSPREIFKYKNTRNDDGKKRIALTFDDGYVNNYQVAFPLLKKHKVPAAFFVSSICLVQPNAILWSDLFDLIRVRNHGRVEVGEMVFESAGGFRMREKKSGVWLDEFIKNSEPSRRDELLEIVGKKYDIKKIVSETDPTYWKLMSPDQVREISESNLVEIGSHGHNHYNLGLIPFEKAKEELIKSRRLLEETCQREVISIAYPDGSYSKEVRTAAFEEGYKFQFAIPYKLKDDAEVPGILRRSGVSGTTNYYSQIIHLHREFSKNGF